MTTWEFSCILKDVILSNFLCDLSAHLILLYMITPTILDEEYSLCTS